MNAVPGRRAVVAATITVVLWASAFVGIRSAGTHFSPGALALGRLLTASLALGVLCWRSGDGVPPRAAWPGILGSGVLWLGLYMVVLNWGERNIDAGTASMLVNIGPILIALLGGWLLREGFPSALLAGMAVSFAGAVVIGLAASGGGHASVTGVVLCLVAAVAYACGVICQKPALRHATPLQVTTFGAFIGTVGCFPFAGQLVTQLGRAPASATACVLYLGLFPTAIGFSTWAYALARTTSGKMGATTYAVPAITVLLSWALLGQAPGWFAIGGGALCLAGVAVSRRRPRLTAVTPLAGQAAIPVTELDGAPAGTPAADLPCRTRAAD